MTDQDKLEVRGAAQRCIHDPTQASGVANRFIQAAETGGPYGGAIGAFFDALKAQAGQTLNIVSMYRH